MAHSRGGWLMAGSITTAGAAAKIPRPCGSHRSFTGTVERYGFSRAVREGRAYTLPRVCIYAADCKSNTNGGTIARVPLFGDAHGLFDQRGCCPASQAPQDRSLSTNAKPATGWFAHHYRAAALKPQASTLADGLLSSRPLGRTFQEHVVRDQHRPLRTTARNA